MKNFLFPIWGIVILATFLFSQTQSSNLPNFVLIDPYGNKIQSSQFYGKRLILAGCFPKDEAICRKAARKIYWLLEKKMMQQKISIERVGFITTKGMPESIQNQIANHLRNPGYETVYLDEDGYFLKDLKEGYIWIQGYDSKGNLKFQEYKKSVTEQDVTRYFNLLKI